jgi:hypothetical protein
MPETVTGFCCRLEYRTFTSATCAFFYLLPAHCLLLSRLIELCESSLVAELLRLPLAAAAAEAPHLLCLADELGLSQLRRAAVGFTAQHYTEVQVRGQAGRGLPDATWVSSLLAIVWCWSCHAYNNGWYAYCISHSLANFFCG